VVIFISCLLVFLSVNTQAKEAVVSEKTPIAKTYFGKNGKGKDIFLEDQKGKVVMVSFWATWCTYCLKEIPVLDSILNLAGDDKMAVIAVNWKEDRKLFRKIAKKAGKKSKMIFTHDRRGTIALPYNVQAIPFLMIYDHNGMQRYKHQGYGEKTLDKIIEEVNGLLVEQALAKNEQKIDKDKSDLDQ